MLTDEQAKRLLEMLKQALRKETFVWESGKSQDEILVAVQDRKIGFVLSMKRSIHKIRLHLRTQAGDIGLARVDPAYRHINPDGTELVGTPHLHLFRNSEDGELAYAEPIDWYDVNDPVQTLSRFLDVIRARFPGGVTMSTVA